jgi:lipocalin
MITHRNIPDIVRDCGGARRISAASLAKGNKWPLKPDAIYKWSITGIPDRHWTLIMSLTPTSPEELYAANLAARQPEHAVAS